MAKTQKWLVTRGMHLGCVKYSVSIGTVITHDVTAGRIKIDGQTFEDTRDLAILKKHGWVREWNAEEEEQLRSEGEQTEAAREAAVAQMKERPSDLPVVQSDDDEHDIIDISHTRKENDTGTREISGDMEVIRGDVEATEHQARLREKQEAEKMPVVRDDSLGTAVSSGPSLNAGTVKTRTAEEHERLRKAGQEKAAEGFTDERVANEMKSKKRAKKSPKKFVTKGGARKARRAVKLDASVLGED